MNDIKLFPCRFCGETPVIGKFEGHIPHCREYPPSMIMKSDSCRYSHAVQNELIHEANSGSHRLICPDWFQEIWNPRNEKFNPFLEVKDE